MTMTTMTMMMTMIEKLWQIITNKREETCVLIDVPIPVDRNVMQNGANRK